MKKTFLLAGLYFLFLASIYISGSAVASPHQNPSTSNLTSRNTNHMDIFINTLNEIDAITNTTQQEDLTDNHEAIITRIGNVIPHDGSVLILNSLRIVFTGRIVAFTNESFGTNILNILRATASLDAVVREFDSRLQQNAQHQ
jgi:hypothetical protein